MKQLDTVDKQVLAKILMDFRNTIQLERDRLYKTRDPDITGIAQAQLKATKAIMKIVREARIKELLHGQRTLDSNEIICYSCLRDTLMEPMKDFDAQVWFTPIRYRITWATK